MTIKFLITHFWVWWKIMHLTCRVPVVMLFTSAGIRCPKLIGHLSIIWNSYYKWSPFRPSEIHLKESIQEWFGCPSVRCRSGDYIYFLPRESPNHFNFKVHKHTIKSSLITLSFYIWPKIISLFAVMWCCVKPC